ncbi:MAG: hypothetical protein PWP23_1607 [Candidatus Sumerlaeota bacterium]|nr:hypothetical protein [Candidatus Sumerlaeota bacterium]
MSSTEHSSIEFNDELPEDLPADPTATYSRQRIPSRQWTDHHTPATGLPVWSTEVLSRTGATPRPAGDTACNFILRECVGQGGFGEVWEAVQVSLGRLVAVKQIQEKHYTVLKAPEEEQAVLEYQFRQEAIITAQLDHPNIVPVYDLGVDENGRPLLAMKMIRGRPWSDIIRQDAPEMPTEEFLMTHLPILVDLAQAVAFAHSRGLVHRDLKPSQVMVGEYGEVLLADWGLALSVREAASDYHILSNVVADIPTPLTANSPAGTPCLMAPEQTLSTAEHISPRTDIYLLGGTLYYLLTGTYPHEAKTAYLSMKRARRGIVQDPQERAVDRIVPPELGNLAMRALRPNPRERLASAELLIKGLKDYLSGASGRRKSFDITARVELKLQGFRKDAAKELSSNLTREILRKHAGDSAITYEFFAECLSDIEQAAQLWPRNLKLGTVREKVLTRYAWTAIENGDLALARVIALRINEAREVEAIQQEIERRERSQERERTKLLAAVSVAATMVVLLAGGAIKYNLDQREANRTLAQRLDESQALRRAADMARNDAESARAVAEREQYYSAINVVRSALDDGRLVEAEHVLLERSPLAHRNWEWGFLLATLHPESMTLAAPQSFHASWSPLGDYIVTGGEGTISRWDAGTGRLEWTRRTNDTVVWTVETSPDATRIAGASHDTTVVLLDAATGDLQRRLTGHKERVRGLAFSPDGSRLVTAGADETVRVWDTETGRQLLLIDAFTDDAYDARFSPDGLRIVTGSKDDRACLWDAATGELLLELPHPENVLSAMYTADGSMLLTSCTDRIARLFDAATGELVRSFDNHTSYIDHADISHDGRLVATADDRGLMRLWNAHTGEEITAIQTDDPMWKVRFDPSGTRLLTTSRTSVRVFELEHLLATPSFAAPVFPLAEDAHIARIPIGHDIRELDYKGLEANWVVPEGATAVEFDGANYLVESRFAVLSPDGTVKIAIDPETCRARVESTTDAALLHDFGKLTVIDAAFSQDGGLAAVAETEEVVHLVETENWQTLRTFGSHSPINLVSQDWSINDVAFSPNGRMLAAGFPRGVVRVWDTESGRVLHEWDSPHGAGVCVAFSPDGALLASGGTEEPSTVWSLDSGREVARLTGHRRTVLGLAFTADSQRLATVSKDRTVKVWDPRTGRELLAVEELPFGGEPLGIAFSTNGFDLVVATNGRGLRVYRAFPWNISDYPGATNRAISERIELWKRRQLIDPALDWEDLRRVVPTPEADGL